MNVQQKEVIINSVLPKLTKLSLLEFDERLKNRSGLEGKEREEFFSEFEIFYRNSLEQICRMTGWNMYHAFGVLKYTYRSFLEQCDNHIEYLSKLFDAVKEVEKERLENALSEIPVDHLGDFDCSQIDDVLSDKEYLYDKITTKNLNDMLLGFVPFEKRIIALRIGLINHRHYSALQIAQILNTSCILVGAIIKRFERYAEWEYIRGMPCE